jgi:hypothetical protein
MKEEGRTRQDSVAAHALGSDPLQLAEADAAYVEVRGDTGESVEGRSADGASGLDVDGEPEAAAGATCGTDLHRRAAGGTDLGIASGPDPKGKGAARPRNGFPLRRLGCRHRDPLLHLRPLRSG